MKHNITVKQSMSRSAKGICAEYVIMWQNWLWNDSSTNESQTSVAASLNHEQMIYKPDIPGISMHGYHDGSSCS